MIPRGRRSDKKSETSEGEKRQLRAVWGSVNWVQCETRPDVSVLASLGMGSLNHSTVQDLCDANMAVERKPNLSSESSFHTFPFTKCVGLPFRMLPWQMPLRITVKELSSFVQLPQDCGTTDLLHWLC